MTHLYPSERNELPVLHDGERACRKDIIQHRAVLQDPGWLRASVRDSRSEPEIVNASNISR